MNERFFVLAGSHSQYKRFIKENKLDKEQFIYLSASIKLIGVRNMPIIRYGDYYDVEYERRDEIRHYENFNCKEQL